MSRMPTSFGVGSLICAGLPEPQNGKQGLRHLFFAQSLLLTTKSQRDQETPGIFKVLVLTFLIVTEVFYSFLCYKLT